jgi:hypothetical protein
MDFAIGINFGGIEFEGAIESKSCNQKTYVYIAASPFLKAIATTS